MFETKQEEFELIIMADKVTSTDTRFDMDRIGLGDNYKPVDSYFKSEKGEVIRRNYNKGERRNSNQTMPRIACQVFEKEILGLSNKEKKDFPICQYGFKSEEICGIFSSIEEFKSHRNTIEYLRYYYDSEKELVFYCWNIFSTIIFVRECLRRFGAKGDKFVLIYREKEAEETEVDEIEVDKTEVNERKIEEIKGYINPYSSNIIQSKNVIFRGAPGTGKSFLAKEIAADIISNGTFTDYKLLTDEQKRQVEFVQFHPSYDYSDFVEGLRPKTNDDGTMGFELQDGVFKKFVDRAKRNIINSKKSKDVIEKEMLVQELISDYFSNIEFGVDELEIGRGTKFYITSVNEKYINISIPANKVSHRLRLNMNELREMLESGKNFNQVKDVTNFFGKVNATQNYSYDLAIFNAIKLNQKEKSKTIDKKEELKPYIFIIDEINRGEISKIFGELFFSIDPGYRGKAGEVSTQYSNIHENPDDKFYIPDNVYIIGTMNDIDRSVDSFDFAMRRRFRFIEIKADDRLEMLDSLGEKKEEAIFRMSALNNEISKVEELNENYHIGASYFLKLKSLSFDKLWTDYINPLLKDYIRGMYDEESIIKEFARAYGYVEPEAGVEEDAVKN